MSEALQQVLGPASPTSVGVLLVGVGVLLAGLGILFQGGDHLVGARHKLIRRTVKKRVERSRAQLSLVTITEHPKKERNR